MSKTHWHENIAHIYAQDAGIFVLCMFIVGAIAIWLSFNEDKED